MNLGPSLQANFFGASASYSETRAIRAPESEKQFWLGRAAAARACGIVQNGSAVELVLNLKKKHCSNPKFAELCETLTTL